MRADPESEVTTRKKLTAGNIESHSAGNLPDPQTPGLFIKVLASGKKAWKYRRRVVGSDTVVERSFGHFPTHSIAVARDWANALNELIEAGIDPRQAEQQESDRASMTVARAHELYLAAVREGRASRASKVNKPRTVADKLAIYRCDIAPRLAKEVIYDVTEEDLTKLVLAKGKHARVRANRLSGELKVFFGWAASLRGLEVGLVSNPATRLTDLKFPEQARKRFLSVQEIGWFLMAVALEKRLYQRGLLLSLLSAARLSEVINARSDEFRNGVWVINGDRVKNDNSHRIALGPWGRSLFLVNSQWVFPSDRIDGPRAPCGWYKARNRVLKRMSELAGRTIEPWTPHDLRRTARSNTKRLNVDFETAEAMLNHSKKGLERIYDGYELEEEKRAWFLKWEQEIARIAREVGVADKLGIPVAPAPLAPSDVPQVRLSYRIVTTMPVFPSKPAPPPV